MSALWLFIADKLKGLWVYVAAAVAGLAAMLLYGVKKSGEGREKGRREQAEKDRRRNAKMADDIRRVLDDPNSAFRVRKPEPGRDDTPAP